MHQFLSRKNLATLARVAVMLVATSAAATTYAAPASTEVAAGHEPVPAFAVIGDVRATNALLGMAERSESLENQRGGTDTTTNNMHLDGNVRDNTATNVVTGSNTIDAGSFANMSGIPMVIQNSGANVLIQNATIINLQFK